MTSGLLLALWSAPALAVSWYGADLGGGDLLLADGDVVYGTFTNVGLFYVPVGATVVVGTGTPFSVYADRVILSGVLDARGAGYAGGLGMAPVAAFPVDGQEGSGPGGGERGAGGNCAHGGGGAGGGYGGAGGNGGYLFAGSSTGWPLPTSGGSVYGFSGDVFTLELGSGGASGGSGCNDPSAPGGAGGGAMRIEAHSVVFAGRIDLTGADGGMGIGSGGGPGGGGSGGTGIIVTDLLDGRGELDARAGLGGIATGLSGGGGGGGGGRLTVHYATQVGLFLPDLFAAGADPGLDSGGMVYPARRGDSGSEVILHVDADGDGITDLHDEFGCGGGDSDGDSVCDAWDQCLGADDRVDGDLDGVPDLCDLCPTASDPFQDDGDADGYGTACDCDDADAAWGFDQSWYRDLDGDGDGNPNITVFRCAQPAGYVLAHTDCNDAQPAANGSAVESCDGIDNDCDGATDEAGATGSTTSWDDGDGDGWGDANDPSSDCVVPAGNVTQVGDCNDGSAAVNPGATEVCNGIDDDCVGGVDSGAVDAPTWYRDLDDDGFGADPVVACNQPGNAVAIGGDCDDGDPALLAGSTWYTDGDLDGLGDPASPVFACSQPADAVSNALDCHDGDPALPTDVWPDLDFDGFGDESASASFACPDADSVANDYDCDDGSAAVSPGEREVCNAIDDDCDDVIDGPTSTDAVDWYRDADGDGFGDDTARTHDCVPAAPSDVLVGGDCDDGDAAVLDGRDWFPDADGDSFGDDAAMYRACVAAAPGDLTTGGDCDGGNPDVNPDAIDVADNAIDENCDGSDGVAIEPDTDTDGDGLTDLVEAGLGTDVDDPDSDADGLEDGQEAPGGDPVDSDADGTIDALDSDDDGDGLPTAVESDDDADEDGIPNHLDLDSDGDGALDAAEGQAGFLDDGGGTATREPPREPGAYGCGCATGRSPGVAWVALPLFLFVKRRSRRSTRAGSVR